MAGPVFVVSGGMGSSGEQLTRTALAQFAGNDVPVHVLPHITAPGQLADVVRQAQVEGGLIVHTLVDVALRDELQRLTQEHHVSAVDLIGPLLMQLTRLIGQEPLGQPGLYHQIHEDYFKRIEAINFTIAHDDGRKPHELREAEIVLLGVSRAGKTPLSMYLATRGWKVANVPLIPTVEPPEQLFAIDARRVVGLVLDPAQLVTYRRVRQRGLGAPGPTPYTDPQSILVEMEFARDIYRRGRFAVVDTSDKPIETSADEVIQHVRRRLK